MTEHLPSLPPHWCHTHYGPFINKLVPLSLMSLHHRAANIQTNHDLMTHDITSVCVCVGGGLSCSNMAGTITKDGSVCNLEGAIFSLSYSIIHYVCLSVCERQRESYPLLY